MSKPFLEQINCPVCDALQGVMTWSAIDGATDPEARSQLFAGEINAFSCRACGYSGQILAPLLYSDSQRQFCVQYYPEEYLEDDEFLDSMSRPNAGSEIIALPAAIRAQSEYLVHPHIVFDLDEMLRFIAFRESIWDRQHLPSDD